MSTSIAHKFHSTPVMHKFTLVCVLLFMVGSVEAGSPTAIGSWGSLVEGKDTMIWNKTEVSNNRGGALLILRCVKGKLSLEVKYDNVVQGNGFSVRAGLRDTQIDWGRSGTSIFASSPVGNVRDLLNLSKFTVRVDSNAGIPYRATWDTTGIDEAIKPFVKYCRKL